MLNQFWPGNKREVTADTYLDYFDQRYRKSLMFRDPWRDYSDRYIGFRKMFAYLLSKKQGNFTILETGALRTPQQWGDGQSSLLFFEFVNFFGGELISIDLDPRALAVSRRVIHRRVPKTGRGELTLINGNSLQVLPKIDKPVDLVYLDSMDIGPDPYPAMLHGLREFAALRSVIRRSSNMMIGIDDNWNGIGKGRYVLRWAKATGQEILHEGYQILFRIRHRGISSG